MTDKSDKTEPSHQELMTQLQQALADETQTATNDRIRLRDAVCDYVSAEQARGTPLKGIILTVRNILRKAEEGSVNASDALARQIINWCIEFHRPAPAL
jgi:hypothetical protein